MLGRRTPHIPPRPPPPPRYRANDPARTPPPPATPPTPQPQPRTPPPDTPPAPRTPPNPPRSPSTPPPATAHSPPPTPPPTPPRTTAAPPPPTPATDCDPPQTQSRTAPMAGVMQHISTAPWQPRSHPSTPKRQQLRVRGPSQAGHPSRGASTQLDRLLRKGLAPHRSGANVDIHGVAGPGVGVHLTLTQIE